MDAALEIIELTLWLGVLLLAAAGYGLVTLRLLKSPLEHESFGHLAALGISVIIAIAGVLLILRAVSAAANFTLVGFGLAIALCEVKFFAQRFRGFLKELAGLGVWDTALIIILAAVSTARVIKIAHAQPQNVFDDFLAYLTFPRQMLASGDFYEPFNLRRMASLGGLSYVQSLVVMLFPLRRAPVADDLLFAAIVAGMALGRAMRAKSIERTASLAVGVLILALNVKRDNLASQMSGFALFYYLCDRILAFSRSEFVGLRDPGRRVAQMLRDILPFAVVAAAVGTFRANFWAPLGVLSLIFAGVVCGRKLAWRELATVAIATGFLLVPWLAVLYRSSGTWLYPLFLGNQAYTPYVSDGGYHVNSLEWYCRAFFSTSMTQLLVVAPLIYVGRRFYSDAVPRVLLLISVAAAGGIALVAAFSTATVDALLRYETPFQDAILACLAMELAPRILRVFQLRRAPAGDLSEMVAKWAVGACAFVLLGGLGIRSFAAQYRLARYPSPMPPADLEPPSVSSQSEGAYKLAQAATGEGCAVAVAVDRPYFLDYARNDVATLDWVGMVYPGPGRMVMDDLSSFTRYFREHGYDFLIAQRPESASVTFYGNQRIEEVFAVNYWFPAQFIADIQGYLRLIRSAEQSGLVCRIDSSLLVIATTEGGCARSCPDRHAPRIARN